MASQSQTSLREEQHRRVAKVDCIGGYAGGLSTNVLVKSRHGHTPQPTLAEYNSKNDKLCSEDRPEFSAATTEEDYLKELCEGARDKHGR
jgi:hypothetical protein